MKVDDLKEYFDCHQLPECYGGTSKRGFEEWYSDTESDCTAAEKVSPFSPRKVRVSYRVFSFCLNYSEARNVCTCDPIYSVPRPVANKLCNKFIVVTFNPCRKMNWKGISVS